MIGRENSNFSPHTGKRSEFFYKFADGNEKITVYEQNLNYMSVEIKVVTTKKELKAFASFGNELYKGNKYYVPAMVSDELNTLSKEKNAAFEFCEAEYYLAYKEGKPVGRVAAIINYKANKKWNVNQVRFGWIDFIDDMEVSTALLDAVKAFGKARGMDSIVGPLGFTDFDPEGMLVEGYDRLGTMVLIYNHPYYVTHLEKLGYVKETDWLEFRITIPESLPERHDRLRDVILKRNNLRILKVTRRLVNKENYGQKFFDLINATYCDLYGFSLLSDKQIKQFVKLYLGLLDLNMVTFIVDEKDDLVAAGVTMASLSEALQKSGGKLFPFGWWYMLSAMYWNKLETMDLLLVAVKPEYQNKGVPALLITDMFTKVKKMGFKYAETNAELEDNCKVQNLWGDFEKEQHKRRRVYGKSID